MTTKSGLGRSLLIRTWPLIALALLALVLWADKSKLWGGSTDIPLTPVNCTTLTTGCTLDDNGHKIRFGTSVQPKPLESFEIWLESAEYDKAEVRFIMEGMDMGFNLYTLRADTKGILRAKVTLPVCVTGRRDWAMILDLGKTRLSVPFVTEL